MVWFVYLGSKALSGGERGSQICKWLALYDLFVVVERYLIESKYIVESIFMTIPRHSLDLKAVSPARPPVPRTRRGPSYHARPPSACLRLCTHP